MYEYLHDTFKTAHSLAKKWREEIEKEREYEDSLSPKEKEEYANEKMKNFYFRDSDEDKAQQELRNYLETLDYKTLKILIEIMYLGRDGCYEEEHGTEETFINRMTEKWPLSEYWEKGFEHLGIDIR